VAQPKSGGGMFVKTLIFAIVVVAAAVAVFVYIRRDQFFGTKPTSTTPPESNSTQPAPQPSTTPSAPASAATQATPPSSAAEMPSASAAPSASSAAKTEIGDPPKDPRQLGPTQGYIYVQTALEGDVYVAAASIGKVNTWVITPCKAVFMRIGRALPAGPQWISDGKTVSVPCQDKLVVAVP
jgi:hypothetical protein